MSEMPSVPEIKQWKREKAYEQMVEDMPIRPPPQMVEDMPIQPPPQYVPQIQAAAMQQNVVPTQGNPFSAQQYADVNLPDVPVSYGGGIAESLLNNNEVPDKVQKKFWFVFHKDNVLTFLDKDRKESKMLSFDITKIDILNSIPYFEYDFEKELEFGILRNVFETKLDRALGFKGATIKNERIMLQSQFSEQRQISEIGQSGAIKEGFFKRLLGRR
jgi:hypothetical protein